MTNLQLSYLELHPYIIALPCLSFLFPSTLSTHSKHDGQVEKYKAPERKREESGERIRSSDDHRLQEMLELEKEKLRQERQLLEERRERETGRSCNMLVLCVQQVDSKKNKWIGVN